MGPRASLRPPHSSAHLRYATASCLVKFCSRNAQVLSVSGKNSVKYFPPGSGQKTHGRVISSSSPRSYSSRSCLICGGIAPKYMAPVPNL